jgi:LmbE family N-acetylglucosaminyl deacetylase
VLEAILRGNGRGLRRVLCLGAHCDDIEIGCGGALLALQRSANVRIDWVVLSSTAERQAETRAAMAALVAPRARGALRFGELPDGRFPAAYAQVKDFVEGLKRSERPDLIFCHERNDRHQDHRTLSEVVWSSFRDHVILEYEIPKWDGDWGQVNLYVPLTGAQARAKVQALLRCFRSQRRRDWFTRDTFLAQLRLRGIECRAPSGYAEGFYARKLRFAGF